MYTAWNGSPGLQEGGGIAKILKYLPVLSNGDEAPSLRLLDSKTGKTDTGKNSQVTDKVFFKKHLLKAVISE